MKKVNLLLLSVEFIKEHYLLIAGVIVLIILIIFNFIKIRSFKKIKCKGFSSRHNSETGTKDRFRWVDVRVYKKQKDVFNKQKGKVEKYDKYEFHRLDGRWHFLIQKEIDQIKKSQAEGKEFPEFDLLNRR